MWSLFSQKMVHPTLNLLIFNFKAIFNKTEKLVVARFYFRKILFIIAKCTHKLSPQIRTF